MNKIENALLVLIASAIKNFKIVTDHHELPEVIPDCICINPKFDDD